MTTDRFTVAAAIAGILTVSAPAVARDEEWSLRECQTWISAWHLSIDRNGNVTGQSDWRYNDPSGNHNAITGTIEPNGTFTLTRHLAGGFMGQVQVYQGQYNQGQAGSNYSAAQGDFTGSGGPCAWSATVIVVSP